MGVRSVAGTVAVTLVGAVALGAMAAAVFLWSGIYNVGATEPHWPVTHWVLETGRMRSIQTHAAGIVVPAGLDDQARIVLGTKHFGAHCAICHGAPGVPRGDIAHGLYPTPPDLANAARRYTQAEQFWILKNGIKSTGMPAWNAHGDDNLWAVVAFLEKLPSLSEPDYGKLVMQGIMMGGQHRHEAH